MEGEKCCFEGCRVHDFLPFLCPICDHSYCLEHRSRFVHSCSSLRHDMVIDDNGDHSNVNPPKSVKQIFKEVEKRFENNSDAVQSNGGASKEHLPLKSTPSGASQIATSTSVTISKLDAIASADTTTEKNRRISLKTKQILLKTKSKGNSSLEESDRFYLTVQFCAQGVASDNLASHVTSVEHIFVSRLSTLGEMLHEIANKYSFNCFGSMQRPESMSLGLFTFDSPDWGVWDRNAPVTSLLEPCESVFVAPVSVDEVVRCQQVNRVAIPPAATTTTPTPEPAALPPATSTEATSAPPPARLCKGDVVQYTSSSGEESLATVIGVHLDDFPNVYYTIRMDGVGGRERQTNADRLKLLSKCVAEAVSSSSSTSAAAAVDVRDAGDLTLPQRPDSFAIIITMGSRQTQVRNVYPGMKVLELKLHLEKMLKVPAISQKLIFKGKVLIDKSTLQQGKVVSGSKVLLMSAAASASSMGGGAAGSGSGSCMAV